MKGIIPAAGFGTRLLPITRVIPKVMIPVLSKPILHFVVEELYSAGVRDILMVVGWKKDIIEHYWEFKEDAMINWLKMHNKNELVERIKNIKPKDLRLSYIEQKVLNGLAGAILLGEDFIEDDDFIVALADNVIIEKEMGSLVKEMIDAHEKYNAHVTLAVMKVPKHLISKFGAIGIEKEEKNDETRIFYVNKIVEKPSEDKAPSQYAIIGRYVLSPLAMEYLRKAPVIKGEISETDAFQMMRDDGYNVIAVDIGNRRWYDVGILEGYAKAFLDLLLFTGNPDVPPEIQERILSWLRELIK